MPEGYSVIYMGFLGMCYPKGYGFLVVLVSNRVMIWPILVSNRISNFWSGLKQGRENHKFGLK